MIINLEIPTVYFIETLLSIPLSIVLAPIQSGSKGILVSSAHELVTAVKSIHLEATETQVRSC